MSGLQVRGDKFMVPIPKSIIPDGYKVLIHFSIPVTKYYFTSVGGYPSVRMEAGIAHLQADTYSSKEI
jgi:hypothetical protein